MPDNLTAQLSIEKKAVTRYFAQYITSRGTVGRKGFGTRALAARFAAKEWLLDQLYGAKVHHSNFHFESGWYARENAWEIERMRYVFNCQWIEENGIEHHRGNTYDEFGDPCDPVMCVDDRKEFCALAWTNEVKTIANMILKGEEPKLSWWVIERNAEYMLGGNQVNRGMPSYPKGTRQWAEARMAEQRSY